jgi:hypothetical protein
MWPAATGLLLIAAVISLVVGYSLRTSASLPRERGAKMSAKEGHPNSELTSNPAQGGAAQSSLTAAPEAAAGISSKARQSEPLETERATFSGHSS